MLTKEAILAATDRKTEDVNVPEWGGVVRVSEMSAIDRDHWEATLTADGKINLQNLRARTAALCIVDDKGQRMFSEKEIEALGRKSASALDRIVKAAQRLNKLTEGDVETARKN